MSNPPRNLIRELAPHSITRRTEKRAPTRAISVQGYIEALLVEALEPRMLLTSSPLQFGSVFIEEDFGSDQHGDTFQMTFQGGASGSQLTRVVIDGDQSMAGFGVGDAFFDTVTLTGLGADEGFDFEVLANSGIDDVQASVVDGTTTLVLMFTGFDAGDRLTFTIDVDEVEEYDSGEPDLSIVNEGFDPITSGVEFQGSMLAVEFTAPYHFDTFGNAEFRNRYDAQLNETSLDLSEDDVDGKRDRTAGAIGSLVQQVRPISLAGNVFEDIDADLVREDNEPGLSAVELQLWRLVDEIYDYTGHTTRTDADGRYEFPVELQLLPGTYQIREAQPAGFVSVGAIPGRAESGIVGKTVLDDPDVLTSITLPHGDLHAVDLDFAEVRLARLEGTVHLSTPEGDCFGNDISHEPLSGVTMRLFDAGGDQIAETVTDEQGHYAFIDLMPGVYSIVEITPDYLIDGGQKAGTVDGEIRGDDDFIDSIREIPLFSGEVGQDYEFCEHRPAEIGGFVYHDLDDDSQREAGEQGIAAVTVQLWSAATESSAAQMVDIAITDGDGAYSFGRVKAGDYSIVEVHPQAWIDGRDTAGTIAGQTVGMASNPGDRIDHVTIRWGDQGVEYNFGELLPAELHGRVHLSTPDGDCFGETVDHAAIEGAEIRLYNSAGDLVESTFSDANGDYSFQQLAPDTYAIEEITPEGLIEGGAHAGEVAGQTRGQAIASAIREINLLSGEVGEDYDFCEHQPASLAGSVYHDRDLDGDRDPTEAAISGVVVRLFDDDNNLVAEAVTNDSGNYAFTQLTAGKYRVAETQPDGWLDGLDTPGQVDGVTHGIASQADDTIDQIMIRWGDEAVEYNFGELLPVALHGRVQLSDEFGNCFSNDSHHEPVVGAEVRLYDADGTLVAVTVSDDAGEYWFMDLYPGSYALEEVTPQGLFDGGAQEGLVDGQPRGMLQDGVILDIRLLSGDVGEQFLFCELLPSRISGFVFQDGPTILLQNGETLPSDISTIRDGVLTDDDQRLGGVTLELRNGVTGEAILGTSALPEYYRDGPIRTTTDANGYYEFTGLFKGNYGVFEIQPNGLIDGIDTTKSGIAVNPNANISPLILSQLVVDPKDDAIIRIALPPGQSSELNNFSEIDVQDDRLIIFSGPARAPIPSPLGDYVSPTLTPAPLLPPFPTSPIVDFGNISTRVHAHTWHLSVIDAGYPRGGGRFVNGPEPIWFGSLETRPVSLSVEVGASWTLYDLTSGQPSSRMFMGGFVGGITVSGDFNGDGLTELGVFHNGQWFIDLNANGRWDEHDLWAKLGHQGDLPVTGDWDGDGKDDIGIFGNAWPGDPHAVRFEPGLPDRENEPTGEQKNIPPQPKDAPLGERIMKLTAAGRLRSDVIDHVFFYGTPGDHPVAGDWNGDGIDTVGVFRNGRWHLDTDGDGQAGRLDLAFTFGQEGDRPIVGDFDGDGVDEVGVFRDGTFLLDTNGNRQQDPADQRITTQAREAPILSGDWNGDGRAGVGVLGHFEGPTRHTAEK